MPVSTTPGHRNLENSHGNSLKWKSMSDHLEQARRFYAEEIRFAANIQSQALIEAFAAVRREDFLGPGPWKIPIPDFLSGEYWTTEDGHPRHVYHNVLIAIDSGRQLNNGQPGSLALWLDGLDLKSGGRVCHIGCGTGYYTAILAHVVGETGSVLAVEVDPALAEASRRNLAPFPQVEVVAADGWEFDPGARDAIFVNAGVTLPNPRWLERLTPGGCLEVPITIIGPGGIPSGMMLKAVKASGGYRARFLSPVAIFSMTSGRSDQENAALRQAFAGGKWAAVRSVRLDRHSPDETCWLHGDRVCLSVKGLENVG
jgi:protein-L-isoaspartate(D-aspartate) O-methyltransferase